MPDTRIRVQKATALLREDHKKVKKLFKAYEDLEGKDASGEKLELFEQIRTELTIHAAIEEEIFYPAIDAIPEDEAHNLIAEAQEEHKIVKQLLDELSGLEPDELEFDAKMKVLSENVLHHAEEEEKDVFPFFDDLPKGQQDHLSWELDKRKSELTEGESDLA